MEDNWLSRTQLLLGTEKLEKLSNKNILIVGLGGVGAYSAEMLCRAGVSKMTIVDGDTVNQTNINRQLIATTQTIGESKADLMADRLLSINPNIELTVIKKYLEVDDMQELVNEPFDYIVDAIDTFSPKMYLIYYSLQNGRRIISSMGAGGKLDPAKVQIENLEKSYNCKLARMLRKRLRRLGVYGGFPVVFSSEQIDPNAVILTNAEKNKKSNVGTISYMPALFGMFCASKVIMDIIKE